jgi:dynein heavy chain
VQILLDGEPNKNLKWEKAKKMMASVDAFKQRLMDKKGENLTEDEVKRVQALMQKEPQFFDVGVMVGKSKAAANLCRWVVNLITFNQIYVKVKPLMESLDAARLLKAQNEASKAAADAEVAKVEAKLEELERKFQAATDDKNIVEAQAAAGQWTHPHPQCVYEIIIFVSMMTFSFLR